MGNNTLNIWYEQRIVGRITANHAGLMGFEYDDQWLKNGFSISQQLPLTIKTYLPETLIAHRFFTNLLPEANARAHIVGQLKISNTDFELLKALGGDCAGALSVLPGDLSPDNLQKSLYQKINSDEFTKLLLRKGTFTSSNSPETRPRLSLAGAQNKCPIYFEDNHFYMPQNSSASSHILKFEITDYKNIPLYEYYLTKLASALAIPCVELSFHTLDKQQYILVKRYDRIVKSSFEVKRLHQEDFCQALGIGYENKYEQHGGPSFVDCFRLIQEVSINPLIDMENLLKWQVFNVLTGNSDAHAKNLSLIYDENFQIRLAPFYDLVCTRAVDRIDHKLAMSIGNEFNPSAITQDNWNALASSCDIKLGYLEKLIRNIATNLMLILKRGKFENLRKQYPALQRVDKIILTQCRKII